MLNSLPELAFDYIINLLIAGNGPFFREFLALAGTSREIRARCIEVAQRALDPSGTWDSFAGPREADIVSHRADGYTPPAWCQSHELTYKQSRDINIVIASSIPSKPNAKHSVLRAHLFLQSMIANVGCLCDFIVSGLIEHAPRDLFDRVNAVANLSQYAIPSDVIITIAARRLPFDLIHPWCFDESTLRGIIFADLRNGDCNLTYARDYMRKVVERGEFIVSPAILLDSAMPTREVANAFSDSVKFAQSPNFATVSWIRIIEYVRHNPDAIYKLRELYEYIPHSCDDMTDCVYFLIIPMFARGIVTHAPWLHGVRILLRYFKRCKMPVDDMFNVQIITQIARGFIEDGRDWPNAAGMRAIFNDLGITEKNDVTFWHKVETHASHCVNSHIVEFVARMKHANLYTSK
jgi:hypothetical protein